MENRIKIIAEAGVNHNGSLQMALQLIDAAVEAEADIIKFQTFNSSSVISKFANKAQYQITNTGNNESQLEMVKKLELSYEDHLYLQEYCNKKNIEFLSTPFDIASIDFLVDHMKLKKLKIPSGEITNAPYLVHIASKQLPVIVSTGMATLGEIEKCLGALAFGYLNSSSNPSMQAFEEAMCSFEGQQILRKNVTLLHCTTEYPAPFKSVNLAAIKTLQQAFQLPVGFSDHTLGISIPIASAALGISVIEKHFTLDKNLPGPDHVASLEPNELKAMITAVRQVEQALGNGIKIPADCEVKNKAIARKSIVAAAPICKGDVFSRENLTVKRPGTGISPFLYWDLLGKTAARDFETDELITSVFK